MVLSVGERRLFTAATILITIAVSVVSAAAQTGLVAAYSFNEGAGTTVADASGKGNTGTITAATWTTTGKFGGALTFNGTNARVTIPDSTLLRLTTAMTLEAWVNPSTVSNSWRDVIYKGNDNYFLEATSSPGSRPATGGTFGSAGAVLSGPAAIAVNTWTHLAGTYDGSTLRLYVNGVQVSSSTRKNNIATSANPLQIGGDTIYSQYFAGRIDEVRIYNVALTAVQVQADMNAAIGSAAAPDMTLTKTHTGSFTQGQTGATYTIAVRNAGTASSSGASTVSDTLPAGLTATAMSGSGWSCTLATRTCTRSDALAAGASYPPVTLTVTVAGTAPPSITNTATVTGGGQTNTANDTATDVTVVTQLPDLTLTKTHAGNFTQGQTGAAYTMTVRNSGTGATTGAVTVTDTLPGGLTATGMSGSGWSCTLATLTCTRSDALAAGATYPAIALAVNVANAAPAGVTNTAAVSGGGQTNTANDTATDATVVTQVPDLTLTKSHPGDFVQGQAGATYTISVRNAGAAATSGTTIVTDTLPGGLTATGLSGSGWNCTLATLTCSRSDALAPGATYAAIAIAVDVASTAPPSITNAATVSGGGQTNTANDTATDVTAVIQLPDLTLTKTHAGNFAQGQTGAAYVLTVRNGGTGATTGVVTMTDTLPGGLTATDMSGTGWSCTLATLTCTRGDALAPGASYAAIQLIVDVASTAPPSVANTASVSGGGETNTANDTATDITPVTQFPDLTLTKTHSGEFAQGQAGAAYTIKVRNDGTGVTSGVVTVTDTLPSGLTATAIGGAGWSCTLATLTCTRNDTLAAGAGYDEINVLVNVAMTAPPGVVNTVSVTGGGETNTGNDIATDPTSVIQLPDLAVTKTHAGTFSQGQTDATYALTVRNAGSAPSSGVVTVTDTLPAALSATGMVGDGWSCTLETVTCSRSDELAPDASYAPITLTVDVARDAPATLANTVSVTGGGDINTSNNVAIDPANVSAVGPDLTITKTHAGSLTQGQAGATYILAVSNNGTIDTTGAVTVTDALPGVLTATGIEGAGWNCTLATLTCTRSDAVAAGAGYDAITVTVDVAGTAPAAITNTATVSGGGETNTSNDTAADPTTVIQLPDLTLTNTHTGSFAQGQTAAAYTVVVANSGTGATTGMVTVTDTLPGGLTATAMAGNGWNCALSSLSCTRGDVLPPGASYPAIVLTVNVALTASATVTNVANASGGGEANTANNAASDVTPVTQLPDLTLTHTHTGDFTQGQTGSYSLGVTNGGSAATTGAVTVAVTLPGGLTGADMSGAGWNCTLATVACTRTDALAAGESYPVITLTVNVASTAPSLVTTAATVSGGGETHTSNNTATDPTAIIQMPDLTLTKTHTGSFTPGQTGATYTITVRNSGAGPTRELVTVTDTLPVGLSATAMSGTGWTCTLAALTCTRRDALEPAGAYAPITLTVDVATNAPASVINTASVNGGGETNAANNSANDTTNINPPPTPDLTLTKTHAGTFTQSQVGASYALTARNVGTGPSSGTVMVTDTLPGGLAATAIAGSGWTCTLATLTCTRGDALAAGAAYPAITLTVSVAANAPSIVTNTASVGGGGESNTSNDASTDVTLIAAQSSGLVAAYAFNEGSGTTVPDSSGNSNIGSVSGTTWTTAGKYGSALSFNGTGARVTIPDAASLRLTNAMTLEAWVRPSSVTSAWRDVVFKGDDNYYLAATTTSSSRPAGGGTLGTVYGTAALAVNTWTHLAVTYDRANVRLYVNGAQVSSVAATAAIASSANPLQIGGDSIYGQFFNGLIDEVRVYNVALTASRIQADMNAAIVVAPDLTLTKTHAGQFTQGQNGASYTLTASNVGNGTTSGTVTVTDTLPGGLTATAMSGAGWTCALASVTCSRTDVLPVWTSYPVITLTVDVASTASSSVTNTATVSGGGETNAANNTASDLTSIAIATQDTQAPSAPGTLAASSAGDQVTLTWGVAIDNVAVTLYRVEQCSGAGCSTFSEIATVSAATQVTMATYTVTNLSPGTYGYRVRAADAAGNLGPYSNVATAAIQDPGSPDLTLTKTHTGNFTLGQSGATYTITVRNSGDAVTSGPVTVSDTLPTGLGVTAIWGIGWSCTVATMACTRGDALAAGTTYPVVTVIVNVASNAPASVTNTATVSGGGETNTSNDTATDPTTVVNQTNTSGVFQNEVLISGMNLPTALQFLPNGDMLILELGGKIWSAPAGTTQVRPTPLLSLTNVGSANGQQGLMGMVLDPAFETSHYYYVFYTLGTPNRDRVSRFTATADYSGTVAGSETVIYQDPEDANTEHHGGALNFANDGKLYITTGEHFDAAASQDLTSPRGKILRVNSDGTIPTDNPFNDGAGPNRDDVWARGLRNPFRSFYDAPTGRLYVADVGGNDYSVAREEVNIGIAGANYGWPDCEGTSCAPNPAYTSPIFSYPHNGRDASITGGFIYRGNQFPAAYYGTYFYADYAQNWIRRLTFDATGAVTGDFAFEPPDGTADGPYGDIVSLTEGPDGALYYVDLGYSDTTGETGISKIRRIRFIPDDLPPTATAAATPTGGPAPLNVTFSSAGSADPEGHPLTYAWSFGDGATSSAANPAHVYTQNGSYVATLTVSDGQVQTSSGPIRINVGHLPVPNILNPANGILFRGGDRIQISGDATDEDETLPDSAFTWNVDFLHAGHVHPGLPTTGTRSLAFDIPTAGHDFSGDTRYRITLTVTDADGLQASQAVTIYPDKVNLNFASNPSGLVITLDGTPHATPFVYDTLINFTHTIDAKNQTVGPNAYTFASWSDGGAQQHVVTVPAASASYAATFSTGAVALPPGLVAGYRLNEGTGTVTADISGNNITGSLLNSPAWATGQYGGALNFSGTSYVNLGNPTSLRLTGSMTLSAWINISANPFDDAAIVAKMGTAGWQLKTSQDTGARTAAIQISSNGSNSIQRYASTVLAANTWYHIAGVYDAAARTLNIYVNGVLANGTLSGTVPAAQSDVAANVNIAQRAGNPNTFNFRGRIDEVHVFNRALTAAEIQTDMTTPR